MSHTCRKKITWYFDPKGERDHKKWFKPNKRFKQSEKKRRKAKEKAALLRGEEKIRWPKTDVWNWN